VSGEAGLAPAKITPLPEHLAAGQMVIDHIQSLPLAKSVVGIGHRIVHGGSQYLSSRVIDPALVAGLRDLIPLAPQHLPQAISAVELFTDGFPSVPEVACFDTAFHSTMPALARKYPLPASNQTREVIRYGFHGLSCESVISSLRSIDESVAVGKVVIAHLGNGASMTALRNGRSIETTMGFTPTGGLMMGNRSGDLDPGVLLYLLTQKGMSTSEIADMVNRQSGLKGVSGLTSDVRELMEQVPVNSNAADAIDLYCYLARKQLGGLIAVLGGLETLAFTGGVGENVASIRSGICSTMGYVGLALDESRNSGNESVISMDGSAVTVRVIPTDEDRMIALHTISAIRGGSDDLSI
jgi:acetate kinase